MGERRREGGGGKEDSDERPTSNCYGPGRLRTEHSHTGTALDLSTDLNPATHIAPAPAPDTPVIPLPTTCRCTISPPYAFCALSLGPPSSQPTKERARRVSY